MTVPMRTCPHLGKWALVESGQMPAEGGSAGAQRGSKAGVPGAGLKLGCPAPYLEVLGPRWELPSQCLGSNRVKQGIIQHHVS